MALSSEDRRALEFAKTILESPSLAVKIADLIGIPIEKGYELLPKKWNVAISDATKRALETALDWALLTMGKKRPLHSSDKFHKYLVAITGGVGGALGLASLPIELPVSTLVMLRSIADIARSEGEQPKSPETKLACLEVFALGGTSARDDNAEVGYYAVRSALAKSISDAARYVSEKGFSEKGAPALVRLIANIASRFGIVVSDKAAAQAVPVIGAAGGAIVNAVFMDHFQDMARGHFIIRRLERTYDPFEVRQEWDRI